MRPRLLLVSGLLLACRGEEARTKLSGLEGPVGITLLQGVAPTAQAPETPAQPSEEAPAALPSPRDSGTADRAATPGPAARAQRAHRPLQARPKAFPALQGTGVALGAPETWEGAEGVARALWLTARAAAAASPAQALHQVLAALGQFENGSLFTLKAALLLRRGDAAGALTAADLSVAATGHWEPRDLPEAYRLRAEALDSLLARFPSEEVRLEAANAQTQWRLLSHGR